MSNVEFEPEFLVKIEETYVISSKYLSSDVIF